MTSSTEQPTNQTQRKTKILGITEMINAIRAGLAVSISDLKKNPSGVIKAANGRVVAVLSHNKAQSYLIPADLYEQLDIEEMLEDLQLAAVVASRISSKEPPVKVLLSEL